MLMDRYFEAIETLQARVRSTQRKAIVQAATVIAEASAVGQAVHLYDTGHIVDHELIRRAGGLLLMKPLRATLHVDNPVRKRDLYGKERSMEGLGEYFLRASNVMPGDVLIMGSVSGKSVEAVDIALAAKEMGVKLIVLTSLTYSSQVKSMHSSQKRLFEIGDIVLDNGAPLGDALLEVEGLGTGICPASGLSAAYIMWAVTAETIDQLMAKGLTPSVYKSYNYADGWAYNDEQEKAYAESGY
ncbi:sugar isomerase domain-containing protein [Paenibacillus guangzhouensis]|uniref:sugar isomerase domain-containing protein n=1 Tax=Paenibacillus guangzhouensis TaxID=1473112 RepID=UPI00187B85B0|nr:sugar isomerase domain-containing protein [Paenibacillus guangzhouensis]